MEMKRMMATAKKLDIVFRVLQWLVIGSMAASVLGVSALTVVALKNPSALVSGSTISLNLGPVTMELTRELASSQGIVVYSWILLITVFISLLTGYFCFKYLRNILSPMMQGNPFHMDASRNLKKLAWVVLGLGIIRNVVNFMGAASVLNLVDLTTCTSIRSATVHMNLELGFLLVFAGLLLLSYIFHYGAALQQLADETL